MRPRVLVGFAESLPAPEVLFSLKRAGFALSAFRRSGSRTPILSVLDVPATELPPPEENFAAAVQGLRQAASAADALLAVDDAALKLCTQSFGPCEGPVAVHATGAQAEIALNKILQLKAARSAGLEVPDTVVIDRPEDFRCAGLLPAIVKPAMAVQVVGGKLGKGATHYLFDEAAAARFEAASDAMFPALVQPLIAGVGEGVFGFADAENVSEWSGHERVRMMNPHGSGSSACRVKMPDADLRGRVEAMIRAIGWRGPFMVEFLRDGAGRAWFMELNGRMWGSMALARRNGFEYPAWAVEAALDRGFVPKRDAQQACDEARHLGRDILHLMFLVRGPRSAFHRRHWPSWRRSLRGVLRPHPLREFYNYDPDHPGFFLRDAWETVASATWRRR